MKKLDVVRCLSVSGPCLIACRSARSNLCADFLPDDGGFKLAILEIQFEKLVQRSVLINFVIHLKIQANFNVIYYSFKD